MKKALSILGLLFLVSCGSSQQSAGPNVAIQLVPLNTSSDIFYFSGPINVQYQLSVANPTNQPIKLRKLELQTIGSGAYAIRNTSSPMNVTIPPNSTSTFTISVWGYSRGGSMRSTEPVTIRGIGYFDASSGPFIRMFTENISPM